MPDFRKARVQSQFGAAADDYATSEIHARGESLDVLIRAIRPFPNWRALDIATGAGHMALALAPHVSRVIASDLTPEMLAAAARLAGEKGLGNVSLARVDAESLPFADGSFDLMTCRLAFHHFSAPLRVFREAARVLKPDGVLGFSDNVTVDDPEAARYYNSYEKLRDPSHVRVYSRTRLISMIEGAGFEVDTVRILRKEFEFQKWADRQRASEARKERLLEMMREVPNPLQPLFAPRWDDATMYFSLEEAVVVGRLTGRSR